MTTLMTEDMTYGRHAEGELTVDKIVGEYWHALSPLDSGRHAQENVEGSWASASEIVRRCRLERMNDDLSVPPQEDTELINVIGPRRPIAMTPVWWERDATPTAVLSARRPAALGKPRDPVNEETVGILPLTEMGADVYKPLPVSRETKIGDFAPIDTRVKPKKIPLWKQALIGLDLMKDPR